VFRAYREHFEEQKRILDARYTAQLEQAVADAVYLASRNAELEQVCLVSCLCTCGRVAGWLTGGLVPPGSGGVATTLGRHLTASDSVMYSSLRYLW
jgi:hypothetical protein